MTTATIPQRSTYKPQCNRCLKAIDSATHAPIINGSVLVGQKLTYRCHGEEKVYEITQSHFELLNEQKIPFVVNEFSPVVEVKETEADAFREEQRMNFRTTRDAVADFVETTINDCIKGIKGFRGDVGKWRGKHDVQLVTPVPEIILRDVDFRNLIIDGKYIGHFELPFYPDQREVKFTPVEIE